VPEIKAAIKAISQGEPLPPFELSELAQQKKEERRLSQIRRANQNQKKAAPLPTREHVPLAANSVAARRLAAKRNGATATGGDVIGSVPHPGYGGPSSSGGSADLLFDDDKPIAAAPAASQSAHDLDFFGVTSAPAAAPAPAAPASNNFFDAFSTPAAPHSAPAPAAAAPQVDLFGSSDLFTSQPPAQTQATQQPQSNNAFDAFGGGSNSLLADMSFSTPPPPTLEDKTKNVLNLFDTRPPGRPQGAVDPYASLMPAGPGPNLGYGQPRPMGQPGAMGYGGMPHQGGMMMQSGMPSMVRPQQPPRQQQQQDPFGSLGGFDAFKK
jgi:hypothetical protein